MLQILEYILGNFWHFLGTVVLICVTGEVLADIIKAFTPDYRPTNYICYKCKEESDENKNDDKEHS